MKVLITGATGYAGSHAAAAMQRAGHDVRLLVRDPAKAERVFTMVGVDALLAGHADHGLRERAHQAYARKCKELGLTANAGEGGSDEA